MFLARLRYFNVTSTFRDRQSYKDLGSELPDWLVFIAVLAKILKNLENFL